MPKYMTKYNAAKLLEKLKSNNLLANDEKLNDFIVAQQQEKDLPIYLKIFVGFGAYIASICFIAFLSAANIINFEHENILIIWGLFFVATAIGLQQISGHSNTAKHSFFIQSSFASMVIGKILFIYAISKILDSAWGITLGLLIITFITYPIYRMSIDRFLSSFALLFTIIANILWDKNLIGSRELLLNGFFFFQLLSAAILLTHSKIKHIFFPLSYAFVFSLCTSVLFFASYAKFGYWQNKELIHLTFINMTLTVSLIALFGWAAGTIEKYKHQPLILSSIAALLLGIISAPGILLTIALMVLGYAKHDKLLITLGALLMPIFLFSYYFNLDVTLMQKSSILIGSGIVLLAGRFYLTYKGWNKGGAS